MNVKGKINLLPKWKSSRINDKFSYWLGSSKLPISTITEDPNFHEFIFDVNSSVSLPSRTKVISDCSKLLAQTKTKIAEAMAVSRKVSITVDIWTSKNFKNSYLGITSHIYNPKTEKRERYFIACRKFDESHTGENIARLLHQIFMEYDIADSVFYCHSDSGANMKKGLRLLEKEGEEDAGVTISPNDVELWDFRTED